MPDLWESGKKCFHPYYHCILACRIVGTSPLQSRLPLYCTNDLFLLLMFLFGKVDDHPEVLDVAAVEAALSFCEEIEDPQSLTSPWEHPLQREHPIQQEHDKQSQMPQMTVTIKQERPDCEELEAKGIRDLMSLGDLGADIKTEPAEQGQVRLGSEEAAVLAARTSEASELRGHISEDEETTVVGLTGSDMDVESTKDDMDRGSVKAEVNR